MGKQQNMKMSINHYLSNMGKLADQWNKYNYEDPDRQRIYLKDIDCPQIWFEKLKDKIPPNIFYLNESTGDLGGPGATSPYEPGIARAGDLMSCLPPPMRAENLMCYVGHEGTYTPAHREMCASLGQNLMVETSKGHFEEGKVTKRGSSLWFMTESKDRHLVSEYWLSTLGHDIEIESHFAQINAWKAAPFKTYIAEQKVGDFILIPPLAPHQVWNRGTRTMKVAWNRTTVETLEMALNEALPRARMVCRDEQYKNKAIVMFTLDKYHKLFRQLELQKQTATPQARTELQYSPKIRQLQKDFRRLFALYTQILLSESLYPVSPSEKRGQFIPYDSNITCSYCRCNIFNRFLTCTTCIIPLENGEEDTYDICMECYAMGRSCRCNSGYNWVEQFPWQELLTKYEVWRHAIIDFGSSDSEKLAIPQMFPVEQKEFGKKTLAQVCQEQLRARPWLDPTKELPPTHKQATRTVPDESQVNDDGTLKARPKKRKSENSLKDYPYCHMCRYPEERWKLALCRCGLAYCYGGMYRAFEEMPLSIMENPDWQCPNCRKICSCAKCRKNPDIRPYEPNGTVLGYDCKKVADPRSWESLVNYSLGNINWVIKAGDDHPMDTRRMQRRRDAAEIDKSKEATLDENNYVDKDAPVELPSANDEIPIDPSLFAAPAPGQNADLERAILNLGAAMRGTQVDDATHEQHPQDNDNEGHLERELVLANGITYEYPDPSQPSQPSMATVPPPPLQHAKSSQESLSEAKRNNRYTIAEAKLSKRSLVVKLRINKDFLQHLSSDGVDTRANEVPRPDRTIIQSDLPGTADSGVKRPGSGKRKRDDDIDDGFTPNKTAKPSKTTSQIPKKRGRKRSTKYSESESEEDFCGRPSTVGGNDNNFTPVNDTNHNKQKRRRSLPTYLAKRNQENGLEESEDELPLGNNYPSSSRKKSPKVQQTKSSKAIIGNGTQRATSTTNGQSISSKNPTDAFPANPVPKARPTTDVSRLAPGAGGDSANNSNRLTSQESQAEKNRQAKLRALAWAAGNISDGSSSSSGDEENDDDDEDLDANAVTRSLQNGGGASKIRPTKSPLPPPPPSAPPSTLKSAMKQTTKTTAMATAPVSIFSKAKKRKVVISSAATAAAAAAGVGQEKRMIMGKGGGGGGGGKARQSI